MIQKICITLFCFSFLLTVSSAQQPDRCATNQYLQFQELKNPGTIQRNILAKEIAKQWIQDHPADLRSTYIIPVVVHVVYKTQAQNISEAQINSQIDVLNEDYNRLNADASNTPSVWQSLGGSISVQFCLAKYDPDGNETSGIERTLTTFDSFDYSSDGVKFTAKGGADAWPNKYYLNIWVCNLANNVLGYATLPSGSSPDKTDGVVVRYKSFGRTGNVTAPYNKGRTATHEVGHWLNLVHTFDGGCSDGDNCADTPPEAEAVYGCPSFPYIDACGNLPNGVMFMNYMDYTDDACMNLFTDCQCNIMTGTLNTFRNDLKSSPAGCQGINFNNDASISIISQPVDTIRSQGFIPIVQLSNRGNNTIDYVKIGYQVDGQTPQYFEINPALPSASAPYPVQLPMYFTGEGGHKFCAWAQDPNHITDEFIFNDTSCSEFFLKSDFVKNTDSIYYDQTGNLITFKIINPSAATMLVQIVNMFGQIVQEGNWPVASSSAFTVDMSNYPAGVYFLYGKIGYDLVKQKFMVIR
jgi:hypothetical protein